MPLTVAHLHATLKSRLPQFSDRLFGQASDTFVGGWEEYLFDTPHGWWTTPNREFPDRGHTSQPARAMKACIEKATHYIDIVTMDEPKGDFRKDVEDGLIALAVSGRPVTVRFLLGRQAGGPNLHTWMMLNQLADRIRQAKPRASQLNVYLAQFRWESASWNHAKLIAIDGGVLITGGHNMWDDHYLAKNPVFDISMRFDGGIARGGHRFADALWNFVRANNRRPPGGATYSNYLNPDLKIDESAPPPRSESFEAVAADASPAADASNRFPALWVASPGWGVYTDPRVLEGAMMIALVEGLKQAKQSCKMSLQDLGSPHMSAVDFKTWRPRDYPFDLIGCGGSWFILPLIDNFAEFLHKNASATLEIILSAPTDGAHSYGHGVKLQTILNLLSQRMNAQFQTSKNHALKILNERVFLKTIAFSDGREAWRDGAKKDNHAKFWILDDKICHVGSDNCYPYVKRIGQAALQEFGVIGEFPPSVRDMVMEGYYNHASRHGVRTDAKLADLTW